MTGGIFHKEKKLNTNLSSGYPLYTLIRIFNLPVDLHLQLSQHTVSPIVRCEIWAFGNTKSIEKLKLSF